MSRSWQIQHEIVRGAYKRFKLQVFADGAPVDLSGTSEINYAVRDKYAGTVLFTKKKTTGGITLDPIPSILYVGVNPADTASVKFLESESRKQMVVDLDVSFSPTLPETVARGSFTILHEV